MVMPQVNFGVQFAGWVILPVSRDNLMFETAAIQVTRCFAPVDVPEQMKGVGYPQKSRYKVFTPGLENLL